MRTRILPGLMNVRAAWKAFHRLRMLDQSDGSVSIVHLATAAGQANAHLLDSILNYVVAELGWR